MEEKDSGSTKQKELVEKIYSVHENLRKQFRQVSQSPCGLVVDAASEIPNWEQVWENHKKNQEELKVSAALAFILLPETGRRKLIFGLNCAGVLGGDA